MPSIRHFAIWSDNPTSLADFYHNVFDMDVVWNMGPNVFMSDGVINVALLKTRPDGPRGIQHFGFLAENFEEIKRRLEVAEVDPPVMKPGDGRYAEWGARDPEGNPFDIGIQGWETERTQQDMPQEEYYDRRRKLGITN